MDPLAGWTVAVTAERRAQEQVDLLQGRGATVLLTPTVRAERAGDADLRAATEALVEHPPDLWVACSAAGVQGWIATAWSWGFGPALLGTLGRSTIVARGASTAGALVGEGFDVDWRSAADTLSEVLDHLRERGLAGRRVAVLPHGSDVAWFCAALSAAGADVIEVPVYRLAGPDMTADLSRLAETLALRELDAVTFTSSAAARNLAAAGGPALVEEMAAAGVLCACVGPVTGETALGVGLENVLVAEPSRLGSMIGLLAAHLGTRGRDLEMGGQRIRLQGARIEIGSGRPRPGPEPGGDHDVRLTPRERALFEAMLGAGGAVLSKRALAQRAWSSPVSEHTVEVTVNRLRTKLGPAAVALQTSNRRGYRLDADPCPAETAEMLALAPGAVSSRSQASSAS